MECEWDWGVGNAEHGADIFKWLVVSDKLVEYLRCRPVIVGANVSDEGLLQTGAIGR